MILRKEQRTPSEREVQFAVVRAAFTLMEMVVVVAIIVALAGLGGYYFLNTLKESQKKTAQVQVKTTLSTAVQNYMIDHGGQPPGQLQDLLRQDDRGGPYLKTQDALVDPWGNRYQYNPSGQNPDTGQQEPEIFTTAPDGKLISNLRRG